MRINRKITSMAGFDVSLVAMKNSESESPFQIGFHIENEFLEFDTFAEYKTESDQIDVFESFQKYPIQSAVSALAKLVLEIKKAYQSDYGVIAEVFQSHQKAISASDALELMRGELDEDYDNEFKSILSVFILSIELAFYDIHNKKQQNKTFSF